MTLFTDAYMSLSSSMSSPLDMREILDFVERWPLDDHSKQGVNLSTSQWGEPGNGEFSKVLWRSNELYSPLPGSLYDCTDWQVD